MDCYDHARATFESYAAMDAPELPAQPMSALQVRLARWQTRNFNSTPIALQTLGIVEETGELLEALRSGSREAVLDAVGDTLIFSTQLATYHRLDFGVLMEASSRPYAPLPDKTAATTEIVVSVGRIAHAILKSEQRIRGYEDPDRGRRDLAIWLPNLVSALRELIWPGTLLEFAYTETAERVLKRNWKADPVGGTEVQP